MVAQTFGPLLGGALTTHLSWRWCFYINLPIGAIAITFICIYLKEHEKSNTGTSRKARIVQMDWLGVSVLIPAVICLLLSLQWGGSRYDWKDARIIVLLALSLTLGVIFAYIQMRKQDRATLPPRVLMKRTIIFGALYSFCIGSGSSIVEYYVRQILA